MRVLGRNPWFRRPRAKRVRDRVARLHRHGREVGLAYVQIVPWAERGRWWWSQWSNSVDAPHVTYLVKGNYSDTITPPDANDEWLDEWARDVLGYGDGLFSADWLSVQESRHMRQSACSGETTER